MSDPARMIARMIGTDTVVECVRVTGAQVMLAEGDKAAKGRHFHRPPLSIGLTGESVAEVTVKAVVKSMLGAPAEYAVTLGWSARDVRGTVMVGTRGAVARAGRRTINQGGQE
jgi:hypothetical protein